MSVMGWRTVLSVALLCTTCGTPPAPPPADTQPDSARSLTLPGWDAGLPSLEVPVPPGYTGRTEHNRDFDVHFLNPPTAAEAIGSVYVGHNPNLLHRQLEVRGDVAERTETIGGEAVAVYEFSIEGPRTVREAALTSVFAARPADDRLQGLQVHVSVTGSTPESVDALWKYISRVHIR